MVERNLFDRLIGKVHTTESLFEVFVQWVTDRGLELYPAQEEAILEILTDHHVILKTPTGSGKSLVAVALHAMAVARGQRAVYTSPIKALVNEKFLDLCDTFGPAQVGMMTGDTSVNRDAPIMCCTAEILANMALREGEKAWGGNRRARASSSWRPAGSGASTEIRVPAAAVGLRAGSCSRAACRK